jgi:hypothetical protein
MMPQRRYGATGKLIFVSGRGRVGEEDRYKIVDRPGYPDCEIHNGDIISVKRGERWIELQAWSDGEVWQFKTLKGQRKIKYHPVQFPARTRLV